MGVTGGYIFKKKLMMPRMGVFEMRNAPSAHTSAPSMPAKVVSGYLRWGCLKCIMPKKVGVWHGAQRAPTSGPNMAAEVSLDPWNGVVLNAQCQKMRFWGFKRAYLCTKHANKNVFGYLGWVCLKCALPKNSGVWDGASSAHTCAPNMPATVGLNT